MRPDPDVVFHSSLGPAQEAAFGLPTGGATLAAAAIIGGIALVAYALRIVFARRGHTQAKLPEPDLASDMQELSDRLAAELDARAARLERLISAADARLVELKQHARRAPVAPQEPPGPDPAQFSDVYQLADAGVSEVEIARRTGRPTGQVQLILNLRRGSVAL